MTKLENFQIGQAVATDKGMRVIAGMKKLKTLDLRTRITDAGLAHLEGLLKLKGLKNLKYLEVTA